MQKSLLSLFFPEGLLNYFDIVDYQTEPTNKELFKKGLTVFLEEKKTIPEEYQDKDIKASGFMDPREINDFPIRDMLVKLHIKRRRWEVVTDGKKQKVSRNWNLVFKGTRMSKDYSAFLKDISRY
ncbi:hypothetical protein EO244_16750 [Ancylomarina salipaludis]|uniref:Transposase n=1 Tax=Ancylomarina salipaludis TaxID=2501299 RepID=A0A4Q1JIJ1_9BACT|nr:hypothetical protein [Ancylomarina salipaludis]RXQ87047.1 hypothetical protein EO244_16750 [Ancylomarina salipaludis]